MLPQRLNKSAGCPSASNTMRRFCPSLDAIVACDVSTTGPLLSAAETSGNRQELKTNILPQSAPRMRGGRHPLMSRPDCVQCASSATSALTC